MRLLSNKYRLLLLLTLILAAGFVATSLAGYLASRNATVKAWFGNDLETMTSFELQA